MRTLGFSFFTRQGNCGRLGQNLAKLSSSSNFSGPQDRQFLFPSAGKQEKYFFIFIYAVHVFLLYNRLIKFKIGFINFSSAYNLLLKKAK